MGKILSVRRCERLGDHERRYGGGITGIHPAGVPVRTASITHRCWAEVRTNFASLGVGNASRGTATADLTCVTLRTATT